ncbi:hypothetical protein [Ferrimonas gelatinilytica]
MGRAIHRRKFHLYGRARPGDLPWELRWTRELDWRRLPWDALWHQLKEGIALTLAVLLVLSVVVVALRMNDALTVAAQASGSRVDSIAVLTESDLAHRVAWLRGRVAQQQARVREMEWRLAVATPNLPRSVQPTAEQVQRERMKLAALRRELVLLTP